jgi:AraC-like DNA-binding protein
VEPKIILIAIFVLTSFIGLWHFIKVPINQSNTFFGLFIVFFALSIVHIVIVNVFFQTKYNPLILIPLNQIFFPLYFLLRYFDKFLSFQVFNRTFENVILIIAFIELSTNLLPVGAWIYTQKFDVHLISFIFWIKRFFVILLLPMSIVLLLILSKSIKKYPERTNDDKLRNKWIREFIVLLSVLIIVIELPEIAYFFEFRSFSLFVLQGAVGSAVVVFMGLRNLNIQVVSAIETAKETNSYNPETNRNFNLIKQLFENEKIYTNSELRISDIAEKISLSPNYVSKIIKENAKIGFNDFVNQYRVNEVIEKLKNKEYLKKNIFALAQETGFKSKSTFQTGFKRVTGKTPTQFINEFEIL